MKFGLDRDTVKTKWVEEIENSMGVFQVIENDRKVDRKTTWYKKQGHFS